MNTTTMPGFTAGASLTIGRALPLKRNTGGIVGCNCTGTECCCTFDYGGIYVHVCCTPEGFCLIFRGDLNWLPGGIRLMG